MTETIINTIIFFFRTFNQTPKLHNVNAKSAHYKHLLHTTGWGWASQILYTKTFILTLSENKQENNKVCNKTTFELNN